MTLNIVYQRDELYFASDSIVTCTSDEGKRSYGFDGVKSVVLRPDLEASSKLGFAPEHPIIMNMSGVVSDCERFAERLLSGSEECSGLKGNFVYAGMSGDRVVLRATDPRCGVFLGGSHCMWITGSGSDAARDSIYAGFIDAASSHPQLGRLFTAKLILKKAREDGLPVGMHELYLDKYVEQVIASEQGSLAEEMPVLREMALKSEAPTINRDFFWIMDNMPKTLALEETGVSPENYLRSVYWNAFLLDRLAKQGRREDESPASFGTMRTLMSLTRDGFVELYMT